MFSLPIVAFSLISYGIEMRAELQSSDVVIVSTRSVWLPVVGQDQPGADPTEEMRLLLSRDRGKKWQAFITLNLSTAKGATFSAERDGLYYFGVQTRLKNGSWFPADGDVSPVRKIYFDQCGIVARLTGRTSLGSSPAPPPAPVEESKAPRLDEAASFKGKVLMVTCGSFRDKDCKTTLLSNAAIRRIGDSTFLVGTAVLPKESREPSAPVSWIRVSEVNLINEFESEEQAFRLMTKTTAGPTP